MNSDKKSLIKETNVIGLYPDRTEQQRALVNKLFKVLETSSNGLYADVFDVF
jgi:hypothetical protein